MIQQPINCDSKVICSLRDSKLVFRLNGWFISIDCYHSSSSKLTALTSYQIRISWIKPNRYSTIKYTLATVIKLVIKTQIIGSLVHFKCTGIEIPIIAVTWDVWQTLHRVFYNLIYMWQAPIIFVSIPIFSSFSRMIRTVICGMSRLYCQMCPQLSCGDFWQIIM